MLGVLFYLACLGLFFTLSLLGPILVALLAKEGAEALRFAFYILVGGFIFGTPMLAMLGRLRRIPQIGRLMLMFLVWTVLPVIAALPFYHKMNMPMVDALFESFSSFTTSGGTTSNALADWPRSILFWRVQLQWLGGYLTLLTVILILAVGTIVVSAKDKSHFGQAATILVDQCQLVHKGCRKFASFNVTHFKIYAQRHLTDGEHPAANLNIGTLKLLRKIAAIGVHNNQFQIHGRRIKPEVCDKRGTGLVGSKVIKRRAEMPQLINFVCCNRRTM